MQRVVEGRARITVRQNAFYNPKMKGLRDMSVLFLRAMGAKKYSVLDSTAATGIRGIRYRLEAGAGKVTLLDINKGTLAGIKGNMKANKVKGSVLNQSIQRFCNTTEDTFQVIDLDPFGTAAPYIYDLMKVSEDGTVMMATCTDTAVLCGAHPQACYKTYGAVPAHNELCHEAATRILIGFIAKIASQFNFGLDMKLSVSNLHYIRVFFVLRHGAKEAVESVKRTGFGSFCNQCRSFSYSFGLAPKISGRCSNCGSENLIFGPLWLGNLHDKKVLGKMAALQSDDIDPDAKRLIGRINSEMDTPFFYSVPKLTRQLGIGAVSKRKVIEKLAGRYAVSETHFDLDGIKTDAPISEVIKAIKGA
ncbi:MAG: hypothetical protein KGH59_03385 [Candidatus Micrarchaeota archaeon]|nr:hypothetical protein [Candidatus Micrarchaeota archaeon]